MTKDCYGTCPKCGEIGWCHYKGKARIFKSGPGSDTYKVSIFKCGNCGKKFGFELEDRVPTFRKSMEEDNDWEEIFSLLLGIDYECLRFTDAKDIESAINIARKHCGCNS